MTNNSKTPDSNPPEAWAPETQLVHGGTLRSQFGETSEALFLTQGFVYASAEQAEARFKNEDPGYQYSRFGNPTVSMFEERMRLLEGAEEARATATGMAAVTAALLGYLRAGDHIIAARAMFGSCRYIVEDLCPRFGIQFTLVDGRQLDNWRAAVRPNTRAFFFETPANPTLELVDIEGVAKIAHDHGALVFVDNVFATPMLQKPLKLGADVVIYSATKHIDGQGRCLGGVVLASADFVKKYLHDFIRQTGPSLSPFNAWVMLKGLETLPIRVRAQCASAAIIADHLAEKHNVISRVLYPGRAAAQGGVRTAHGVQESQALGWWLRQHEVEQRFFAGGVHRRAERRTFMDGGQVIPPSHARSSRERDHPFAEIFPAS